MRVIAPSKGRDIAKLVCYTVISMDTRNWKSWTSKPLAENINSANDSVSLNNITLSFGSIERILKFVFVFLYCVCICVYIFVLYCIVFVYCVCIFVLCLYLCLYFCIVFVYIIYTIN